MAFKHYFIWGLALLGLAACSQDEPSAPEDSIRFPSDAPFDQLSDYGLFDGPLAGLEPAEGLIPYELNTPLFTDYSDKHRFVYVPGGQRIPYDASGTLDLPVGSILVKNFSYTTPQDDRRHIETRLLLHYADGWEAETYLWRDDQQEADRLVAGKALPVDFRRPDGSAESITYLVPNKNECKGCHATGNTVVPIGPKVANLNKPFAYADGTFNQLDYWHAHGILEQPPATLPRWPAHMDITAPLNDRARAYLDVNCGHCHSPTGAANNSGLDLRYSNTDSLSLGFFKPPIAAGEGSGGLDYSIVPGQPDQSILVYRMEDNRVNVRMPELGRTIRDEEGIALIRAWIEEME